MLPADTVTRRIDARIAGGGMNKRSLREVLVITFFAIHSLHTQPAAAANKIVLEIRDNTSSAAHFYSTINNTAFIAGKEVRFVAPDGNVAYHDLINGNEEWIFDLRTGEMEEVTNTQPTPGSSNPDTVCPTGCEGIGQNNVFFAANLGFVAPHTGNPAGINYGPAVLVSETFFLLDIRSIKFPVLEMQWLDMSMRFGQGDRDGIMFHCIDLQDPEEECPVARCMMEHTITEEEHRALANVTLQMDLTVVQRSPCHPGVSPL
jgi:hypothetical protein